MLDLRKKAQAHIDASAPEPLQRKVEYSEEESGAWSIGERGPRYLSADELTELADLAYEIKTRLEAARDDAIAALRAHAVHTPVPTQGSENAD